VIIKILEFKQKIKLSPQKAKLLSSTILHLQ